MNGRLSAVIIVAGLVFFVAPDAEAYIGPGAGLAVIGTIIALFVSIVFAVLGFVWYPIKRLRAKLRARNSGDESRNETEAR